MHRLDVPADLPIADRIESNGSFISEILFQVFLENGGTSFGPLIDPIGRPSPLIWRRLIPVSNFPLLSGDWIPDNCVIMFYDKLLVSA